MWWLVVPQHLLSPTTSSVLTIEINYYSSLQQGIEPIYRQPDSGALRWSGYTVTYNHMKIFFIVVRI